MKLSCSLCSKMDGQHKMKWTVYITLASMFIFISVSEVGPFFNKNQPMFPEEPPKKYVIIFDGGSTGTRIHIFTFANSISNGQLNLKNEYFEQVKPGLSNYARKPRKAAESVMHLLEKAKYLVPFDSWDATPIAVKATAGLRLLPDSESESILSTVYEALQKSPFQCDVDCVSVLDGEDEGLYGWYTVNFLLGRLTDSSHSVVSLDLGGGSTQVTFTPVEIDTFLHSPKEYTVVTKIHNKTMPIYTHSYLGLGLMSARIAILQLSSDNKVISSSEEATFKSSCIHPKRQSTWKHDLKEYIVMGREDNKYGFKECYHNAVEFLKDGVDNPEELQRREIYAMSYYFDRALDLGIIGDHGGVLTIEKYKNACKTACSGNSSKDIFLCLDCSYIVAFLHHGLGFSEKKEIKLVQQIDGIETSWALGAAFKMLS